MTDDLSYRLYLDERFKGLHTSMNGQFIEVHEKLKSIEEQTKKTNGRVTELECWKANHCGEESGIEKQKKRQGVARNLTIERGLTILGFLVIIGIAVWNNTINRKNSQDLRAVQDTLRREVRLTKGIPNITRGWLHVNDNGLLDSIYVLKK